MAKAKLASLRDLRIADLDLFITAARFKSLGQAATLHHLSQSAASAAIWRVEAAFGRVVYA
jgi:DNA-binding transcriptional LysR family regulator